jgi:hypothetical protein
VAAPEPKSKKIHIARNPATIRQFLAILMIRKATGDISQEEVERELAAVRAIERSDDD